MEETQSNKNNSRRRWSSATNWNISSGSLDASLTFHDSSSSSDYFPIHSQTITKNPLILQSPSPDCGPCQITIRFPQKHVVRQVYVRSTAQVYEIYFAPSLHSSNKYLCTVRCGITGRDDEVLNLTDNTQSKGSAGELAKEKCNEDDNIAFNEDEWVVVKNPDSSLQDNRKNSMPKKIDANSGTNVQEFYKATAQITDSDACVSLTICLLSLQSNGCLYVDKISVDSETQAAEVGNSAKSSLMAIRAPTHMQLSKTGISQKKDKHASDTTENGEYLEDVSRITGSTNFSNEIRQVECMATQQDVKLQEVSEAIPEPPQVQIAAQVLDRERRHDSVDKTNVPYDHIESALEQLISRVSRIEDICSRFEENMLKPISSMEARLQQVEQQVEMLSKNSQYSGLLSCTRTFVPPFSCQGSNYNSLYNEWSDYPSCKAVDFSEKNIPSEKLSNPPDMSLSLNDAQFLPRLVVTAPEFSCGDDEENNDTLESENNDALGPSEDCLQEKSKQAMSIDDALDIALAGFSSTRMVQPLNYSETHAFKAPDFTIEENDDDGEVASLDARSDKAIVAPGFSHDPKGTKCINNSISTSNSTPSILGIGQAMGKIDDHCLKERSEGVGGHHQLHEGNANCSSLGTSSDCPISQAELELAQTDDCHIAEATRGREASDGIGVSVSEKTDILRQQFHRNETGDSYDALHEGTAASSEDVVKGSENEMLQNVFKSSPPCVMDFELPILDVKFASWGTPSAKSRIESLLANMPEFEVEAPRNLIYVGDEDEDEDEDSPVDWDHHFVDWDRIYVDWDCYDGREKKSEGEALQDFNTQEAGTVNVCKSHIGLFVH